MLVGSSGKEWQFRVQSICNGLSGVEENFVFEAQRSRGNKHAQEENEVEGNGAFIRSPTSFQPLLSGHGTPFLCDQASRTDGARATLQAFGTTLRLDAQLVGRLNNPQCSSGSFLQHEVSVAVRMKPPKVDLQWLWGRLTSHIDNHILPGAR